MRKFVIRLLDCSTLNYQLKKNQSNNQDRPGCYTQTVFSSWTDNLNWYYELLPNIFYKRTFKKPNFWVRDFSQPSLVLQMYHFNDWPPHVNIGTSWSPLRSLPALKVHDSKKPSPACFRGWLGQELDSKTPATWLCGQPTISLTGSNFICQPDGSQRGLSDQLYQPAPGGGLSCSVLRRR